MKLSIPTNNEAASRPQWVDFDMKGYEANLTEPLEKRIRFLVRPQMRTLVTRVEKLAESAEKSAKTFRKADAAVEDALPEGSGGDYFTRELASQLLEDWDNIVDQDEVALECNRTNKIWLFEQIDIAIWVITKAKEIANRTIQDEAKNSNS